ncbi:MAG: GspH/FimT family pseudopilin [Planctomycetota bacterium]
MSRRVRPAPPRRTAPGFSLVELILTALIVGLVAAIALPRYADALALHHADAAARRVVADLEYARAHALATSQTVEVAFDLDLDTLTVPGLAALDAPRQDHTTRLADEPYRADLTQADFNQAPTVSFNGYGRPSSGGEVHLRVGSRTRTVRLDAHSGEADLP